MTNQNPLGGRASGMFPTIPRGEIVQTYETYPEAQQAVDVLAKADFPVEQVSIVGSDLKSVERVTGKLSWGRVAAAGAASGAWLGLFFGILLIIFTPAVGFAFIIAAILFGAGFGMLFGIASYAINRRRRDYTSVMQVLATSYSVIVGGELVNRARNLLRSGGAETRAGASAGWMPGAGAPGSAPVDEPQHPSDPPRQQFVPPQHPSEPPLAPPADDGEPGERPSEDPPRRS